MKNIIVVIALLVLGLQACTNEPDFEVVRKEVLDAHDKIMMDGELAINNKMKLDTIATSLDSLSKIKVISDQLSALKKINMLRAKLNHADEQMNEWMHHFKADLEGKSNQEAMDYFVSEKAKIKSLDSLYQVANKESAIYLLKFMK